MKSTPLLCLLFLLTAVSFCHAQQNEAFSKLKATVRYLDGGMRLNTVIDPEARTAVETLLDSKDREVRKTTYLLDEKDFAMGAIHYDGRGNIRYKETYARDPAGLVVEAKLTSADGRPLGRRVYTYNGTKPTGVIDFDASDRRITPQTVTTTRPVKKK